jgi:hypothetical protein
MPVEILMTEGHCDDCDKWVSALYTPSFYLNSKIVATDISLCKACVGPAEEKSKEELSQIIKDGCTEIKRKMSECLRRNFKSRVK